MMRLEAEISGCSIVLLGKFNPVIFQPAWLRANEIDGVSTDAEVQIVHRDICQFTIETRNYFVDDDRFQLNTASAPWVLISDIATRIFLEFLAHTPVRAFGINRDVHFRLPSPEHRLALGRKLAPLQPWGDFGEEMESDDPDKIGGLQKLHMKRKSEIDGARIDTNAVIEPSARLDAQTGVYMQINTHHALTDLPDGHGATEAATMLSSRFEDVVEESEAIVDRIMEEGLAQ